MEAARSENSFLLEADKGLGIYETESHENSLGADNRKKSFWSDTTRRQKFITAFAAVATSSIYFCQSTPSTFLARVILARGGKKVYAAAIINASYFLASVSSLACGNYQSKLPTKKFIWIGLLIVALSQGCLTFLDYLDNVSLLAVGIAAKAVQGIGQGCYNVSILTLLWQELPEHVEKAFGMTKSMTSFGFLLGPILGSQLFSIRNEMMTPFLVSASVPLLLSLVGWIFLPDVVATTTTTDEYNGRSWYYIFRPKSVVALGLAATCSGAFAIYDASFTTYTQKMGVSVILVGWIMTTSDAFISGTCVVLGYIYDSSRVTRIIIMSCCFLGYFGINFAFISRQPIVALFVEATCFGIFAITVQSLAFVEMMHHAIGDDKELKSNFAFQSRLSGVWYFMVAFSMVIYGILGTGLQSILPYYVSQTITALVGISLTVTIASSIYLFRRQQNK